MTNSWIPLNSVSDEVSMREQGQRLQARKEWPRTDSIHLRNVVNKYESLLKVCFIKKQTLVSLPIWPSSLSQAAFIWVQFSKHNCSWFRLFNPVMGATSDSFRPDPTARRPREQKRFGAWCSARGRVRQEPLVPKVTLLQYNELKPTKAAFVPSV